MAKTKEKNPKVVGETMKFALKTLWKNKPVVIFLYAFMLIAQVSITMLEVVLPKYIIDEVVYILKGDGTNFHLKRAVIFAGLLIVLTLFASLLQTLFQQIINFYREWFYQHIETELLTHSMTMDFEHTENPEVLDKLEKAKDGIGWYSGGIIGITDKIYEIAKNISVLCGVSFVIFLICPILLPVQIISLIIVSILNRICNKIDEENFAKLSVINRRFGYIFWELTDYKYGKDIRLYDSVGMIEDLQKDYCKDSIGLWKKSSNVSRNMGFIRAIVNSLRDGICYFYIGFLAITKAISIGDFSMCTNSASTFYQSIYNLTYNVMDIRKACRYAHRYLEFKAYPMAMEKGTKSVKNGDHEIEFKNVSFKYPRSDSYTLKNVSIKIKSGEHLSVVGLNGAGKTTFIKLLCRLYDVTEGEILIDGTNIKEYSDAEYRKLLAVVFQDFRLFAFSLRDNIALNGEADDEKIEEVLKLSGLYDDATKLENGLDTMLYKSFDEKGTELSGGQQQKVAICRALYKNSPIVILDEPTAALDPIAEYEIYRQFNTLVGGKTAIYISHRLSSCKFCDKIAVFADQTIKEYGTHDQLVNLKDGIYAEMFNAQAQYYVN